MELQKGYFIIEGCFGCFLSKEPSDSYYCETCGSTEIDIGYAETIEEAVILIMDWDCYNGFEIEDEYDLESFIDTWARVAEKWQEYF